MDASQSQAPEPLGWNGVGAVLILLVAAFSLHGRVSDQSLPYSLMRVLWWLIYLSTTATLMQRFGTQWLMWAVRHQPALCALLVLAVGSFLWSLDRPHTLHKALSLIGTTVTGIFIGYTVAPPRLLRVLHWTFAIVIVSSIVVALVLPSPVTEPWEALGWRGIMGDKNGFGAFAAFAAMFFIVTTLTREIHPVWGATFAILWLLALALSRSRTAAIALVVLLVAFAYLRKAWAMRRSIQPLFRRVSLGLVLVISALPLLLGLLAEVVGPRVSLSSRVWIWQGATMILRERPLTGYGYAAVWGRQDATLLPHIPVTAMRSALNAHNSIMDVAADLGIPAAIIAGAYLFGALSIAGRLFKRTPSAFSMFVLLFLMGIVVMSFTEAHLLRIHTFFWMLLVAITVSVKRTLLKSDAPSHGLTT
jgi:O-antigen ligase